MEKIPETLLSHTGIMVDLDLMFGLVTNEATLGKGHLWGDRDQRRDPWLILAAGTCFFFPVSFLKEALCSRTLALEGVTFEGRKP